MTVKRFDISGEHYEVFGDNNGEYCLYEDCAELQRQLTAYEATVTNMTAQVQGLAVEMFNLGYQRGHTSTVDGYYVDIHQSDMTTYHEDIVSEILEEKGCNTDAALAEIRNEARAEGINFAAGRLAAAFNNGFIDKPLPEVFDVTRMILTAKEDIANEPAADGLSGEYAETALKEWEQQLRKEQSK